MAATRGASSTPPSFTLPCPKSPPEYPDLYGKRRETAKVQMLEREIGFLQEELKSVEGFQPASKLCKEVTDFVVANSDPFIPTTRKITRRSCRLWEWLWGLRCFNFSSICCCCWSECSLRLELSRCCDCHCNCKLCSSCPPPPKWQCCFTCPPSNCCKFDCLKPCKDTTCLPSCCTCEYPSCPDCSSLCCCRWKCTFPKCPKCCNSMDCCCKNPCCLFF